jgi:hypothetical protein
MAEKCNVPVRYQTLKTGISVETLAVCVRVSDPGILNSQHASERVASKYHDLDGNSQRVCWYQ